MLRILVAIAALAFAASLVPAVFADTTLTLDPIPGKAYEGQTVTFTGTLYADGWPLAGKTVWIQEDDPGPDEWLANGRTDQNGRFSINWRVDAATFETEFDIYAIFEGDSSHGKDRTRNQNMDVFEHRGTTVTLYAIPDRVYAGDTITFTGTLTHGGQPLANKKVWIQDEDNAGLDDNLKSGTTNQYGQFSITWVAAQVDPNLTLEIRAVFEGDSSYGRDASPIQDMIVAKIGGDITLDPFPRTAKVGQAVTFSGTLSLDRGSTEGAVVYIKDEDSFGRDDLLVTGYVESNGRFSATWIAEHMDPGATLEIFAVFEGDYRHSRQATCNDLCGNTVPLRISGRVDVPPPTAPPPGSGSNVPDGAQYMEMFYAFDMRGSPRVAIVLHPETHAQVQSHIVPAREGVLTWVDALERKYNRGNWDVTFEYVFPEERFDSKPDVIMNLVTNEIDAGCGVDYAGWAETSATPTKPVQTTVCSTSQGEKRTNQDVARIAGHEFIHAMGLGHAFNKPGDVMCSTEDTGPTCGRSGGWFSPPSNLNLGAVAQMYGADGFANPNNYVAYKSRFAEGTAGASSNVQPPGAPPQTRTQSFPNGCTTDDKSYNINMKNYELKPGRFASYTICNTGTVQYSFAATDRDAGFKLYVLPPETGVSDFVKKRDGSYYTCEDPDKRWYSKPGTCNVDVGSRIVFHNDRTVSITINGKITTSQTRTQSFPNGCTTDDKSYNINMKNYELKPGRFASYTICNTGTVQYSFAATDRDAGFKLYVLPPETGVSDFVKKRGGSYYTCEDPDKRWYSMSGTCNVDVGSRIVFHNDRTVSITINGRVVT